MDPSSPPQLTALRAVLDRLIPADDFPGALAAGTEHYVLHQLAGDSAADAAAIGLGLAQLDADAASRYKAVTFSALTSDQQDTLLSELDSAGAPFVHRLVDLAHEGFYADPANGGNRDAASWRMLGYASQSSAGLRPAANPPSPAPPSKSPASSSPPPPNSLP